MQRGCRARRGGTVPGQRRAVISHVVEDVPCGSAPVFTLRQSSRLETSLVLTDSGAQRCPQWGWQWRGGVGFMPELIPPLLPHPLQKAELVATRARLSCEHGTLGRRETGPVLCCHSHEIGGGDSGAPGVSNGSWILGWAHGPVPTPSIPCHSFLRF